MNGLPNSENRFFAATPASAEIVPEPELHERIVQPNTPTSLEMQNLQNHLVQLTSALGSKTKIVDSLMDLGDIAVFERNVTLAHKEISSAANYIAAVDQSTFGLVSLEAALENYKSEVERFINAIIARKAQITSAQIPGTEKGVA